MLGVMIFMCVPVNFTYNSWQIDYLHELSFFWRITVEKSMKQVTMCGTVRALVVFVTIQLIDVTVVMPQNHQRVTVAFFTWQGNKASSSLIQLRSHCCIKWIVKGRPFLKSVAKLIPALAKWYRLINCTSSNNSSTFFPSWKVHVSVSSTLNHLRGFWSCLK